MEDIATKGVKSLGWSALSTFYQKGVHIGTTIILMRLLPPKYFGIVALAAVFRGMASQTSSLASHKSLVQRTDQGEKAKSVHFTLTLIWSGVTFLIGVTLSYFLRGRYSPIVLNILVVLCFFSAVQIMDHTPGAILAKKMNFKASGIAVIIANTFTAITSIILALVGYGLWGLVLFTGGKFAIKTPLFWLFSSERPKIRFDKGLVKWFLKFNFILFVTSQLSFLLTKFDSFLVGTYLDLTILGFYNKAFSFSHLPILLVTLVLSRVALPGYANLQKRKGKLSKSYSLFLSGGIRLSWPLAVSMMLVVPQITIFLWGRKWLPMVPFFRLLLIYNLSSPIFLLTTQLYTAMGKPEILMKVKGLQVGVMIPLSLYLLTQFGAEGVAISRGIIGILGSLLLLSLYLPESIDVSFKKILLPPILALVGSLFIYFFIVDYLTSPFLLLEILYKTSVFNGVYFSFLLILEKERIERVVKVYLSKLFSS